MGISVPPHAFDQLEFVDDRIFDLPIGFQLSLPRGPVFGKASVYGPDQDGKGNIYKEMQWTEDGKHQTYESGYGNSPAQFISAVSALHKYRKLIGKIRKKVSHINISPF